MKYMGSKARIAKHILPIILKDRREDQWYVEPFVGGCNTIDKVNGLRLGSDANKYLIAMYQMLQNSGVPEDLREIPKTQYNLARDQYNGRYDHKLNDSIIGWIGYMASANGRFFEGGYSGKSETKIGTVRDYIDESVRGIEKQLPLLADISFVYEQYQNLVIPPQSIIYCDPPYQGTKQYAAICKEFDYPAFWQWCREKHAEGHTVFVSEYNAPEDFICVWEKEVKSSLSANGKIGGNKNSTEKLFTLK
jgi:DNA adenine methylase